MKRKLKSRSGETLVETLFALLVVVLAFTMLAGSILAAARVNKAAKELNPAFQMEQPESVNGVTVTIKHADTLSDMIPVKGYQTEDKNKYCYYDVGSD